MGLVVWSIRREMARLELATVRRARPEWRGGGSKAPKLELGLVVIKAGWGGWRGDVRAELWVHGIDGRRPLAGKRVGVARR